MVSVGGNAFAGDAAFRMVHEADWWKCTRSPGGKHVGLVLRLPQAICPKHNMFFI